MIDDAITSSLAGAAFGLIATVLLCIFWEACSRPDDPDPHHDGFIQLHKMPADRAVIYPADRSVFWAGEKLERELASTEPRS